MPKPSAKGPVKRQQVSNACTSCRISKLKCNGQHPVCYRCHTKDLQCVYDVSEGMTKRQHLNHELVEQKLELERATAVLRVLQYGTDQEATASLARLRFGSSIEEEYNRLLPQAPKQSGLTIENNMSQGQLPTPANEQPDDPMSWNCLPAGGYVGYNAVPGTEQMDWTNPLSPISQTSSVRANSTVESPFLDMMAAEPSSNDVGDERHSCLGG